MRWGFWTLATAITIAGAASAQGTAPSASVSAAASGSAAPHPGAPPLGIHVQPIFGNEAAVGFGWQDFVVTIDNPTPTQQKGTVELRSHMSTYVDRDSFVAKAPFVVVAGKTVSVRLPMRARNDQVPTLTLRVVDDRGTEIAAMPVTPNMNVQPTLVDIDNPSRLAIPLRGWPATTTYSLTPSYTYYTYAPAPSTAMNIAVATPHFDATTGDPVLPTRAAAYSGVTAVLVHSDLLARLEPEPKDALLDWVAGGGTLALVVSRPEDLHGPEITKLAGTGVASGPVNPALEKIMAVPKPVPAGGTGTGTGFGGIRWDTTGDEPSGGGGFQFIRTSPLVAPSTGGPGPLVLPKLVGFTGGALVPSNFGSTAHYGRGQVHLLAFDPTESPMVDDVWVQSRIVDMMNRAWDRRASVVFPAGSNPRNAMAAYYGYGSGKTDDVRRALDPNENFRPALGFAAILLVLYSIFVGPVNFLRAKNRGKPLRPLLLAPIFSAVAFGAIVLVGLGVKGWRGRTRHLAFAETGSGSTRTSITRFRGFYTSETRSLSITASDRTSVLDVLSSDSIMDDKALVRVDRDGFSLENITSLPWQTLVVRENGFIDLKGGVTITTATTPPSTEVKNDTGSTLLDALVYVPGDGVRYFESIKNGDKVTASSGRLVLSGASRRTTSAGAMTVHAFDPATIATMLDSKTGDRVTKTWAPITQVAGDAIDWWPDDKTVVLADVEGGEHVKSDNGLSVEADRMLLRVVSP
jgi:hypothetical protein